MYEEKEVLKEPCVIDVGKTILLVSLVKMYIAYWYQSTLDTFIGHPRKQVQQYETDNLNGHTKNKYTTGFQSFFSSAP